MIRTAFALTAAVLFGLAAGCTMCANPYDACGPTFTGGDALGCMPNARACSILSPVMPPTGCCETEPGLLPLAEEPGEPVWVVPPPEQTGGDVAADPPRAVVATQPQSAETGPLQPQR